MVAPAKELAALYHARWHIESVFDELKTHLRQSRRVLRSKTPELVRQEFYGWMLAHYAVRWLMQNAANQPKMFTCFDAPNPNPALSPPDRPRKRKRWFAQLLQRASELKCVQSRQRKNPRMVKRRGTAFASHQRG